MKIVIPLYCVQNPPPFDTIEDSMMDLYAKMFRKYLKERSLIPKGNLVEVKYEDFIREPIKIIQQMYSELNLDGFIASRATFDTYLQNQKSFNGESYTISDEVREKVDTRWGFIKEAFDYS